MNILLEKDMVSSVYGLFDLGKKDTRDALIRTACFQHLSSLVVVITIGVSWRHDVDEVLTTTWKYP